MSVNHSYVHPKTDPLDSIIENSEMEKVGNMMQGQFSFDAGECVMRIRGNMSPLVTVIYCEIDGEHVSDNKWTSPYDVTLLNVVLRVPIRIKTSGIHILNLTSSNPVEINRIWFKKR